MNFSLENLTSTVRIALGLKFFQFIWDSESGLLGFFRDFLETLRDFRIPIPGILGISGFSRDFAGFSNPDPRNFGNFGISHSGFFRDYFELFKSRSRSPRLTGFQTRDFRDFRDLSIKPKIKNPGRYSRLGLSKKSHLKANSVLSSRLDQKTRSRNQNPAKFPSAESRKFPNRKMSNPLHLKSLEDRDFLRSGFWIPECEIFWSPEFGIFYLMI